MESWHPLTNGPRVDADGELASINKALVAALPDKDVLESAFELLASMPPQGHFHNPAAALCAAINAYLWGLRVCGIHFTGSALSDAACAALRKAFPSLDQDIVTYHCSSEKGATARMAVLYAQLTRMIAKSQKAVNVEN